MGGMIGFWGIVCVCGEYFVVDRVDLVWSLWAMAFEGKTGQVEGLPSRRQLRPSPPSTKNPRDKGGVASEVVLRRDYA